MTDAEIVAAAREAIDAGFVTGTAARVIPVLLPLLDLGPNDALFRAATYPFDSPASAKQMAAEQSGCGLYVEVGWRGPDPHKGLVDDARLHLPYGKRCTQGGVLYAVTLEGVIGREHGALVSGMPWIEGTPFPLPADCLVMGMRGNPAFARGPGVNTEHACTALHWHESEVLNGTVLSSLDGGQDGNHNRVRTRALVEVWTGRRGDLRTGELWAANLDKQGRYALGADGRPTWGRRVMHFIDVSKLKVRA
jgi:hypothetical protein